MNHDRSPKVTTAAIGAGGGGRRCHSHGTHDLVTGGCREEHHQYSFSGSVDRSETATGEPGDTGLCSPVETITFQGKFSVHVAATQPGLSDDEVLAALNTNDPIVVRAHFIERGSFTLQAGGHTYTGRYVSSFGGQINSRTMVFHGSFSATGKSDAGTQLVIHFSGHATFFDGAPRISKEHLRVTGCVTE